MDLSRVFFFSNNINSDKLKKVPLFNLNDSMNCICLLFSVICGSTGLSEKSFSLTSGSLCIIYTIDMNHFSPINVKVEHNSNILGRSPREGP